MIANTQHLCQSVMGPANARKYTSRTSDPLPQSGPYLTSRLDTSIVDGETKGRHGWYVEVVEEVEVVLLFCDLY